MQLYQKSIQTLFPRYKNLFQRPIDKPNQQLETFIKNQLPEMITLLQNMQSLYNRMLTLHVNLIMKKQSHESLFQSFLRKVSEKVEKYFQKLQDGIIKQAQQNQHFNFQDIRTNFRQRLETISSDLSSKFLKNKNLNRKTEEQITQSLYLLLEFYQFTKLDAGQIITKYKLKSNQILTQIINQYNASALNELIYFDAQFKDSVQDYIRKKFAPFMQKRDFLSSKVREILKQTQSKFGIDNKMFLKGVLNKQQNRCEKDIFNYLQKQIRNKQVSKYYEQQISQINEQISSLKSEFFKIKNVPYYLDIIKGNFIQTYQMETKKLQNIFFMGKLQKYMQQVLSFVQRIKKLIQKISSNRKNQKTQLGHLLDDAAKSAIENLQLICQSGTNISDLIDSEFQRLTTLIVQMDYEGGVTDLDPLERYKQQQRRRQDQRKYKNNVDKQKKQEQARRRKIQMEQRAQEQRRIRQQRKRKDQQKKIRDQQQRQKKQQERKIEQAQRLKKIEQQRKQREQKKRIEDEKRRQEQQRKKIQKQKQQQLRRAREEQQRKRRQQQRKIQQAERMKKMQIQKQRQEQQRRQRQQKKRKQQQQKRLKQQQQQKKRQEQNLKQQKQNQQKRKIQLQKQKQLEQKRKQEQLKQKQIQDKRRQQQQKRKQQEKRKQQQLEQKKQQQRRKQQQKKRQQQRKRKQQQERKKRQNQTKQQQQKRRQQQQRIAQQKRRQQQLRIAQQKKKQQQQKRKQQQQKRLNQQKRKKQQQKLAQQKRKQQLRIAQQKKRKQQQKIAQQKRRQEQQKIAQQKRRQQQQKRKQQQQKRKKQQQRLAQEKRKQQQQKKKLQQKKKQQQIQRQKKQEEKRQQQQKKRQQEIQKQKQLQQKKRLEQEKKKAQQKKKIQQQKKLQQIKKAQELKKAQQKKLAQQKQKQLAKIKLKGQTDRNFNYQDMYDQDEDMIDQDDNKNKGKNNNAAPPQKKVQNKKKDDDFQFLNDDVDFGDEPNNEIESRIKYEDDFEDEGGEGEQQAQSVETKQLLAPQNIKIFNDYLKGSQYMRKNKVNLQPFNEFAHFISIFQQFIQNREIYLFDSQLGELIFQVAEKYQDMQTYQQQASQIYHQMQKNYYQNLQSTQFFPQTHYFFPLENQNKFDIRIIQVIPAQNHFIIFLNKPLPQQEAIINQFYLLIQTFGVIFQIQAQQQSSPKVNYVVLTKQNLTILNTFDKHLPNMLILFNYLYEYKGKPLQIDQYTIQRFFYTSHCLSNLYEIIQNQDQTLNKFFENQNQKFQSDKTYKTVYHQFTIADPNLSNKLFSSFKSDKENFIKGNINSVLHLIQIEKVDQQQKYIGKIAIYIEMTKANPKPNLNIYLFNSDMESTEHNQRIYEILMAENETRFEINTYMDYTRHNGLYEYSSWSLPLWAHICVKKKMKPCDAIAVLNFSMLPYYTAFKVQD